MIIEKHTDLQFIWAVFSGFPPEINVDISDDSSLPYADGNQTLWNKKRVPQHEKALVEIVCWDSSETIFTTDDPKLIKLFMSKFTDAREL